MNNREREILSVLCNSVRAMSFQQIARTWWTDTPWGIHRTKMTCKELCDAGWLDMRRVMARPVRPLECPIATWMPSVELFDVADLSKTLHQRSQLSAVLTPVVFATRVSVELFGKRNLPPIKLTQMTHDLSVSEVFLNYRLKGLADHWIGEDQLPTEWLIKQRPDAVLCSEEGHIYRAIEYGGDYSPERLMELHEGFSKSGDGLPYEIW